MEYKAITTTHPPIVEELEQWTFDYRELVTILQNNISGTYIVYFKRLKVQP